MFFCFRTSRAGVVDDRGEWGRGRWARLRPAPPATPHHPPSPPATHTTIVSNVSATTPNNKMTPSLTITTITTLLMSHQQTTITTNNTTTSDRLMTQQMLLEKYHFPIVRHSHCPAITPSRTHISRRKPRSVTPSLIAEVQLLRGGTKLSPLATLLLTMSD